MAILTRAIQKIFGDSAGTGEFGVIGSKAAGAAATTKNLTTMQSLTEYLQGLNGITSDQGTSLLPFLEDMNSLFFMTTSQLAYLTQNGIPEWLNSADQRYYADVSFVQVAGDIYQAIKGDDGANINTQEDPTTEPEWWRLVYETPIVPFWDIVEAVLYDTAGVIVQQFGKHYTSTGLAGNTGKSPVDPQNSLYWYASPGIDKLIELSRDGTPKNAGMHAINDVQDGDYQTSLLLDKANIGGTEYEFYRVAMDGSVVTGDGILEAIFDPGGAKEYPFIDLYAPDNVGTRTLVDIQGRSLRSMTGGGGVAATLGEVQGDAGQTTRGEFNILSRSDSQLIVSSFVGAFSLGTPTANTISVGDGVGSRPAENVEFDSADSISPNAAKTNDVETRVKAIVKGVDYIVVMIAA